MCERSAPRDEKGRLLPGARLNPAGKPALSPYARLLAAAEAAGATVVICLPPKVANDALSVPPEAA